MGDRRQDNTIEDRIQQLERQIRYLKSEQAARTGERALTAVERAEALYELRRARSLFFGANADLFCEPAWDMLLDIFIARERGTDLSVSDTCLGSGVPTTTALRWIAVLETRGLITKVRDSHDGRRFFVRLTPQAYETLRLYLEAC
jgi:hypothetical protein